MSTLPRWPHRRDQRIDEEAFARDLALMLASGLTLQEGLQALREQSGDLRGMALARINKALVEGAALSAALESSGQFSPVLVATVRASEVTGHLAPALKRYADGMQKVRVLQAKLTSALVYPALLVAVATLVVAFLLVYVVPRFASILEGSGRDLPWMSRLMVAGARMLNELPLEVWVVLAALALYGAARALKAVQRRGMGPLLLPLVARVPGMRELVRHFTLGRMTRSAAMLIESGIPAIKALAMCRGLLGDADQEALDQTVAEATTGAPLAHAMHSHGLVDTVGARILRVSERTGQLPLALDRLADLHDHRLNVALDRATRLIEPVLMLVIGLVIGGIVVLMYLPIFELAAGLN